MINIILLSILLCSLAFSVELTAPVYKVFRTGGFETIQSPKDSSTSKLPKKLVAVFERKESDYLVTIGQESKKKYLATSTCEGKEDITELSLLAGSFLFFCPVDPERDDLVWRISKTLTMPWKRVKVNMDYDNDGKTGEIGYLFYQDFIDRELYMLVVYDPHTKLLKYFYGYIHNKNDNSKEYLLETYEVKIEESRPVQEQKKQQFPPMPPINK